MIKVSIIVPIYNVEPYLERCLNSIVSQTYSELEIILVNDGSTDSSGIICQRYKANDKRIILINKENGGLSSARNAGIDCATGQYLFFVDSDDFIHPECVKTLLYICEKYGCDIGQCGVQRFNNSKAIVSVGMGAQQDNFLIEDSITFINNLYVGSNVVTWNKLYKRDLFFQIRFPEGRIHEDMATTYLLIDKANAIGITDSPLYYYFINPDGISKSMIKTQRLDLLLAYKEQIIYFHNKHYSTAYRIASHMYICSFGYLISFSKKRYVDYKAFKSNINEIYQKNRTFIKGLPIKRYLKFLVIISPRSLFFFRTLYKVSHFFSN